VQIFPDRVGGGAPEGGRRRSPVDSRDAVVARQIRAKGETQLPGRSRYGDGMMHGGNYGARNKKSNFFY